MALLRRRRLSIDHKLPLINATLILLTVALLGWSAYARLQGALLDSAGQRLLGSARSVAGMVSVSRTPIDSSRLFAAPQSDRDTMRLYAAVVEADGKVRREFHRPPLRRPRWPFEAIEAGRIQGDTVSLGPFEYLAGTIVISRVQPVVGARTRPVAYLVEVSAIASSRNADRFEQLIEHDAELLIGQPGEGVWTDFSRVAGAPSVRVDTDSIIDMPGRVAATARVPGLNWMVWVSASKHSILAPARAILWSVVPTGLLVALISAAIMWRVARRITHPIVQLTAAAEGVANDANAVAEISGAPAARTAPAGADEVMRLRFAFEQMATRLAEREALAAQLRQAQKMEAIGRLAGGVAHDFNNLLTAIRSYSDLILEDMASWDPKRSDVMEIRRAAERAAGLTAQLLAFSRKQMLQPRVLDTRAVLSDSRGILERLMIEDIELTVEAAEDVWPVKADPSQLDQVLLNLALNARDAMPNGGSLRITAANEVLDNPLETRHGVIPAGEYVAIRVGDTGMGMDTSTQARVFEPFFTTKAVGEGTGLGLATVHGVVSQSGGFIRVESHLQKGTTFTVYLPRAHDEPRPRHTPVPATHQQGRAESILLVEDEPAVRALARRVLVRAGFRVLDATGPTEALQLARDHAQEIVLVLTDVVMPVKSGPQLVEELAEICPRARVLYISGYTDHEVISRGLGTPGMRLLQKPFSAQQLVDGVRSAIDFSNREIGSKDLAS